MCYTGIFFSAEKIDFKFMEYQNQKKTNEQDARTRLLEAGITLFAEKGYAGTSVREIVERAVVTKPVLYYYFKSKEGIFRAILDWAADQQEDLLTQVLKTPGTFLDRLIHLCSLVYQGVLENQNLSKMIHNLIFGPPQGVPKYDFKQYHRRMVQAVKAIYLEGLARDEVKKAEPDEVANLVLGLIDYCLHLDNIYPESLDPGRPERLLRLAFEGMEKKDSLERKRQQAYEQN